ncbi:hypothetical protein [Mycolicibacterium psychrotolerans]|uniref:Uncharacterized protein n=1 Tax=Mycolicibacterium psychrotolerans TaxID=216929 RepID=A0A7I7M7F5_9MYCO|nr:hypothetical protein [Mycolicibacterium psychrotolerans]BBX68161.1 hypothetical protein MPSYJ_16220 [Mycolicibacterium psychrotolerans]
MSIASGRIGSVVADQIIDLTDAELPTLAHLAEILHDNFPTVRADLFLTAVEKHGLPQIVRTLEVLASAGFAMPVSAVLFGGGGGAGSPGSPIGMADLELLWQFLSQQLPAAMIQGFADVVGAFMPASVSTAQVQRAVQVLTFAPPVAPPAPVAAPVMPSSVVATPPAPAVATPPPAPAPPSPAPAPPSPAPVVVAAPPPVEVSAPPTVEISTPAPPTKTPEVTPGPSVPEADDTGNKGIGDDSGPAEGSSPGDVSGPQHGGGPNGDTAHGGDAGSAPGQGSGDASGPDNGRSGGAAGGGRSGDTGSDGG